MSKVISQMLDYPERQVAKLINKLEDKNGYPSHDVRLLAENIQKVRVKIAGLKLDPDDTTADELYHALLVKFQDDSRRFDEYFGVQGANLDEKMRKAAEIISKNIDLSEKWVLKTPAAKALLRQHLPKRLMKQLHYRSVDSLLKRQDPAETYLVLRIAESPSWNRAQAKLVSALDSTAFELRPLKVIALPSGHWGLTDQASTEYSNDYGVLGLLPAPGLERASLLSMVVMLLDRLAGFQDINTSKLAARFSPAAAWWADMDCLIAHLDGGHVSLSLKDVADNHLMGLDLGGHQLESARKSFWKELLARYENQLLPDEDSLAELVNPFKNTAPLNRPAFEYAYAEDA